MCQSRTVETKGAPRIIKTNQSEEIFRFRLGYCPGKSKTTVNNVADMI